MSQKRPTCLRCRKPLVTCYCRLVCPFISTPRFVILIHRDEARRSIATGRMAHLCLENSELIEGTDFSENEAVNEILSDSSLYPLILYPSPGALNLSVATFNEKRALIPAGKQAVVFVVDGTWHTARRMRRLSQNVAALPAISLSPTKPSEFWVRKQPRPECLSTIEAIHQVIDLWPSFGPRESAPHDRMLQVFHSMVSTQLEYERARRTVAGVYVERLTRHARDREVV